MAKFNIGDEIYSEMNPFIKYKILQVGLLNENREPEYEVENISEDQMYAGRKYRMRIDKVDRWGVLIPNGNSERSRFEVLKDSVLWHIKNSVSNGHPDKCGQCELTEWIENLCKLALGTKLPAWKKTDMHEGVNYALDEAFFVWNGYALSINELENCLPKIEVK